MKTSTLLLLFTQAIPALGFYQKREPLTTFTPKEDSSEAEALNVAEDRADLDWIDFVQYPAGLAQHTERILEDRCKKKCGNFKGQKNPVCIQVCVQETMCKTKCKKRRGSKKEKKLCVTACRSCPKPPPKPSVECLGATTKEPGLIYQMAHETITDLFPFLYDAQPDDKYIIEDGGQDTYDDGNAIGTPLTGLQDTCCTVGEQNERVPWTGGKVVDGTKTFGPGSKYYTIEGPAFFVLSVRGATVKSVWINGSLGAAYDGPIDAFRFDVVVDGFRFKVITKASAPGFGVDMGANHVWIFPMDAPCRPRGTKDPIQTYAKDPDDDFDKIDRPGANFDYILLGKWSRSDTSNIPRNEIVSFVKRYIAGSSLKRKVPRQNKPEDRCKKKCRNIKGQKNPQCVEVCVKEKMCKTKCKKIRGLKKDKKLCAKACSSCPKPKPKPSVKCLGATSKTPGLLYQMIDDTVKDPFAFQYDAPVGEHYIKDGGFDMFDDGNAVGTPLTGLSQFPGSYGDESERVPWTGGKVVDGTKTFGPGSKYYTVEGPAVFVLSVRGATVNSVWINGDLGQGAEPIAAFNFDVTIEGSRFKVITKASTPGGSEGAGANHVWIFPMDTPCRPKGTKGPIQTYDKDPGYGYDKIKNPGANFDYILIGKWSGTETSNIPKKELEAFVKRYIAGV